MADMVRVVTGDQLRALSADLKAAGSDLRKEIPKGMREAAKPVVKQIKANASTVLPASGGLAATIAASKITVRTRTTGTRAGVGIIGIHRKASGLLDLKAVDRGQLRHPVFGDPTVWVTQSVGAKFWNMAIDKAGPHVQRAMLKVIDDIRAKFAAGG